MAQRGQTARAELPSQALMPRECPPPATSATTGSRSPRAPSPTPHACPQGPLHAKSRVPVHLLHEVLSPFTNQPKQEGPQTSHASSRSIPEPPKPCSPGRMRQPEADDRREKTCVPSVSVLALFSFPRGNVNWIRLTFRQFPAAQQFLRGHLAPGRTGLSDHAAHTTQSQSREQLE